MSLPRARTAALLLLSIYGFVTLAATLQLDVYGPSNTSSDAVELPVSNISSDNSENGDCFNNPATPRRGFYPANIQDCLNAVKELYYLKHPHRPVTFARARNVGFKLPKVVRNGTCVISIDVMNDADRDYFQPWLIYITARDIAISCTLGTYRFGGRKRTGPRKVVDVLVFGRVWPLENGLVEPIDSKSGVTVDSEQFAGGDSSLLNKTSLSLTEAPGMNTTSLNGNLACDASELGGALECYDPPLPRERAWRINVKDCEVAAEGILEGREQDQRYTFSREAVAAKFYYPLPATYKYRSCVVSLDMNNNSDRDTVRLSIVEATAWVLAHKCSGEERSADRYGGRATVGGGSKNLIKVWVYGRLWPPAVGVTNVTNLVLAQSAPLIDGE